MSITNGIHPPVDQSAQLSELRESYAYLVERIAELEQDDRGWQRLSVGKDMEFSREGLRNITRDCRLNFLKNSLIARGVAVKRFYVWGSGVNIRAKDDEINAVIQSFLDDLKNQVELTSHQARMLKEVSLQTEGNIFLIFFVSKQTGHVRVRSIAFDEIEDIICNPDDGKEPWYYKRVWTEQRLNFDTGTYTPVSHTAYYPDWGYDPQSRPASIGGSKIEWDTPIFHIKTGGFSGWKFGVTELYPALAWANAYKTFLERWNSIVAALAVFATQVSGIKDKNQMAAVKAKLNTGLPGSANNPPAGVGSTALVGEGLKFEPFRTSGVTTSADDGRRMSLMAMMVMGLPETFFSDASVGSLATARSLDRPTELMMVDRQTFWADVHRRIFNFVLLQAIEFGGLKGKATIIVDEDGSDGTERIVWNKGVDGTIDIDFPPLVSDDVAAQVNAVVAAATLGGSADAGTLEKKTTTSLLLNLLAVPNADDVLAAMFNDDGTLKNPPPPKVVANPFGTPPQMDAADGVDTADVLPVASPAAEAIMVSAARKLQETLDTILREVTA